MNQKDRNNIESCFVGLMHDAVLMWAYGVNKTLQQGFDPNNGVKVTQNIYNMTFEGVTGPVIIDENGDRTPNYKVHYIYQLKVI